ncbi:MAG: hypothetical protein LBR54_03205 [Oscillospiraceae bacterium]|jgi:hypothetical protein|nr:hypothetical protein [Oscillospiraceae bacterium]
MKIFLAVVLVLLILSIINISAVLLYVDGQFRFKLKYAGITLFSNSKARTKKRGKHLFKKAGHMSSARKRTNKNQSNSMTERIKNSDKMLKSKSGSKSLPMSHERLLEIVQTVLESGERLLKSIKIRRVFIDFKVGDDDAFVCAMKCAGLNIAVYNILGFLSQYCNITKKKISIESVYATVPAVYDCGVTVKMTTAGALRTVMSLMKAFAVRGKK